MTVTIAGITMWVAGLIQHEKKLVGVTLDGRALGDAQVEELRREVPLRAPEPGGATVGLTVWVPHPGGSIANRAFPLAELGQVREVCKASRIRVG